MAQAIALPGDEVVGVVLPDQLAGLGIAHPVPILKVTWFDDRQTCSRVHDYLDHVIEGTYSDYSGCTAYAAGVCGDTGGAGLPCMFHEPESAPIWQRARGWKRVQHDDGSPVLVPRS